MRRSLRWLIFAPAALLAVTSPATAEAQPGLNAVGYTYPPTGIPLRVDDLYATCGQEIENNINRNFNGEPFQDCPPDFFMVHYSGYITIPENDTIQFMVAADDGGTVKIGDTEFGTWNLKGCSWSQQVGLDVDAGSYPLDGWFFEWGGGTCYMLAWRINNGPWEIVPDSAFLRNPPTPSTTTLPPTTTTTTEPPTTTTQAPTTTTEPPTTTTTQTTTTTTEAPPPQTTTTTVYVPPATTTTEAPPPTTTVPETTTTEPETTTSSTSTTTEPQTTTSSSTTIPRTTVPPTTTAPETTTTQPSTTTQPQPRPTQPETTAPPQVTTDAEPQQIIAAVQELDATQAEEVFAELNVAALDDEQEAALIEAVQAAPEEVRQAFEEQVDIFKEGLDDYVPVGSTIPVGQRRTIVAIGAVITAAGASTRIRR